MDVNAETARKLREMGAAELLAALSAQDEAVCAGMAFAERVQMAVDEAHSDFITQKVRNLTRRAGLRYPEADVVSVNLFFTSFAKQARRSRKGGFTGCANVFSPIPVTA